MSIRYIGPYMHRVLVQPGHTHVMTSFRDSMAFSSVILSGLSSDVCFLISEIGEIEILLEQLLKKEDVKVRRFT